jgi:hypothetical protein
VTTDNTAIAVLSICLEWGGLRILLQFRAVKIKLLLPIFNKGAGCFDAMFNFLVCFAVKRPVTAQI